MDTNDGTWGRDPSPNGLVMGRNRCTGARRARGTLCGPGGTVHDAHGGPKSADRARRLGSMSDLRHRIDIINGYIMVIFPGFLVLK